jgi:hypothetical protein
MGWKDPARKKAYQAAWYQRNKERTKEARAAWGKANNEKRREYVRRWEERHPREYMIQKSKHNAKSRGIEHTITVTDLEWPTHCPVLGIELAYDRKRKGPRRYNYASLDRKDNAKGYVPGNVFIISWWANRLKHDMTIQEVEQLLSYMKS